MLAATEFEFKQRFWIIGAIFFLAFLSYRLDAQNAGTALVDWIARVRGTMPSNTAYHLIFFVGALCTVAAAAIRTWGTAYLNSETMIAMRVQTSRLVADGPYRYVRNPLYFGNILWAAGFGLMASRVGFLILVGGMIIFSYRLITREEAGIAANQGDSYRSYRAAVPRLLPVLRPKLPPAGGVPNWADGLLGEAFVWVMAASEVAFAITLNQTVFFVIMGASFVVYAICLAVIKKRHKAPNTPAEECSTERPTKRAS